MKTLATLAAAFGLALGLMAEVSAAESGRLPAKDVGFSFEGPFGIFDRGQLQRGYLVYKTVCASCHSMNFLYYRNLGEPGGPEFDGPQVKAIAAEFEVEDGPNQEGEMFKRPGRPSDRFLAPFPNEEAARFANGGALPPDLSLITKARSGWSGNLATLYTTHLFKGVGGPEYVYSLLTGYQDPPSDITDRPENMHYNPYFESGHWTAMPPPLTGDDAVTYGDGTKATIDQMAKDVSAFLAWAAEPKMEARKSAGFQVLLYLAVLTLLMYLVKRKIWDRVAH